MKIQNTLSKFAALLVAGSVSFGVFAAEDAAGVRRATDEALKASQAALEQCKGGDKEAAIASIKLYRQKSKEITGSAASMSLQKAMGSAKEAANDLEAGNTAAACEKLADVANRMATIKNETK